MTRENRDVLFDGFVAGLSPLVPAFEHGGKGGGKDKNEPGNKPRPGTVLGPVEVDDGRGGTETWMIVVSKDQGPDKGSSVPKGKNK